MRSVYVCKIAFEHWKSDISILFKAFLPSSLCKQQKLSNQARVQARVCRKWRTDLFFLIFQHRRSWRRPLSRLFVEQEGGLIHYTVTLGLSFFRSRWHQMLCGLFSAQRGVQSWALYNTHSSSQFAVATDNRKCNQFHKQKSL